MIYCIVELMVEYIVMLLSTVHILSPLKTLTLLKFYLNCAKALQYNTIQNDIKDKSLFSFLSFSDNVLSTGCVMILDKQ